MWAQSLSWEDPLEEKIPLQYSCLENPMDRGAWSLYWVFSLLVILCVYSLLRPGSTLESALVPATLPSLYGLPPSPSFIKARVGHKSPLRTTLSRDPGPALGT